MHATDGIRRVAPARGFASRCQLADIAVATIGTALLIGAFLASRRAAGAIAVPLPASQLVWTALVLIVWACLARELVKRTIGPVWATLAPLSVLLLVAVACSFPGKRAVEWLIWLPAISAFLIGDRTGRFARRLLPGGRARSSSLTAGSVASDGQIVQQLARYRTAAGQDVVRGILTAEFSPGERTATLYAAFCPPFERLPQVEAEIRDSDSSAAAKLVQVLHNGIQLEVRLARPAPQRRCLAVEFFAAEPSGAV